MKISYGITVCNEHKELQHLIEFISPIIDKEDEIVVVYDQNRVTDQVLDELKNHQDKIQAFPFNFQQNFLENKNYMNSECKGDYIFQIDADEIPSTSLLQNLKSILLYNPVDTLICPRANIVKGLTQEHINKWRWQINDKGHINWPDQQKRIYKNNPKIKWSGHKVHGMIEGYDTFSILPLDEKYCIYHNKEIKRQEEQNERYDKIENNQL